MPRLSVGGARRSSLWRRLRPRATALALLALAALALGGILVPEAGAQTTEEVWSGDVVVAFLDDLGGGYGHGYVAAAHPSTSSGGVLSDDDFDIDGTTYTVWRITVDSESRPYLPYFTVATGSTPAVADLPDKSELILRLTYHGVAGDFNLSDATYTGSSGAAIAQGFRWNTEHPSGDFPPSRGTMTVALLRMTNTAPTGADNRVETTPGTAYTFTADDFGFADADGDSLASVTIATLPSPGTLALDGTAVSADDVIPSADIDADKLTFTPAPGERGTTYASFTFKVNDGTVDSDSPYTMTIDATYGAPRNLRVIENDVRLRLMWSGPAARSSTLTGYEYRYAQGTSVTGNPTWTDVTGGAGGSEVVVTGLQNSTSYTFEVRAVYGTETSEAIAVTVRTAVPTPRLRADYATGVAGNTTIELAWTAIATLGAEAVTGYRIEESETRTGTWAELVADTGDTNTTYRRTGLIRDDVRYYRVRALSASKTSEFSARVGAGTRPSAPAKPVATLTALRHGSYILSWPYVTSDRRGADDYEFRIPGVRVWRERPSVRTDGHRYISVSGLEDVVANVQVRAIILGRRLPGGADESIAGPWSDKAQIADDSLDIPPNPFTGLIIGTRSHDGIRPFSLELQFNRAPEPLNGRTVREALLEVSGGTVTDARRVTPGSDRRWRITVQPAGAGDVRVELPAGSQPCTDEATVCAGVERLVETVSHVVRGSGAVLSASFAAVPSSHDGETPFTVKLTFSEEPALSYKTVRDALLKVSGGTVTGASRVTKGSDREWNVSVVTLRFTTGEHRTCWTSRRSTTSGYGCATRRSRSRSTSGSDSGPSRMQDSSGGIRSSCSTRAVSFSTFSDRAIPGAGATS